MAEGGGLLNRYTLLRRIEGSNPSVSASCGKFGFFRKELGLPDGVPSSSGGDRYCDGPTWR